MYGYIVRTAVPRSESPGTANHQSRYRRRKLRGLCREGSVEGQGRERHALRGDVSGGRRTEYEPALSQSGLFFVRFTLRLKRAPIEMPASHAQMDTRVLCTRRYV